MKITARLAGETALVAVLASLLAFGAQNLMSSSGAAPEPAAVAGGIGPHPDSFSAIVEAVKPAVVNVSTTAKRRPRDRGGAHGSEEPQSLGSGLVLEPDGHVLTNDHVISEGGAITVRLSNDEEYQARVVGRDPLTDLALLKVDAPRPLPVAPLADSDRLRVGDWVLAIGNPFGLEQTVTAGIVSAKGRVIGESPDDDFIQTDAAINPGNSGGPLFNARGEVVGITNIIFSPTGESVGIGLAVPINLVRELVPQLKANGRVVRGWLGLRIHPTTTEPARTPALRRLGGAVVTQVISDGPAAHSGLQKGDVIVDFDGKPIRRPEELARLAARGPVGHDVRLRLLRGEEELAVTIKLGELPARFRRLHAPAGDYHPVRLERAPVSPVRGA